jgi:hypothetical protein
MRKRTTIADKGELNCSRSHQQLVAVVTGTSLPGHLLSPEKLMLAAISLTTLL